MSTSRRTCTCCNADCHADAAALRQAAEVTLLSVFDECLNRRAHLLLEVGYNRVTDWMVIVHDATGVGIRNAERIISTQSTDRDEAMAEATEQLRTRFLS